MGTIELTLNSAQGLRNVETFGKQDPYVVIQCGKASQRSKTHTDGGKNPVWNQNFTFRVTNEKELVLKVYDANVIATDTLIGSAVVSLDKAYTQGSQVVSAPVISGGRASGTINVYVRCVAKPPGYTSTSTTSQPGAFPPQHQQPAGAAAYPTNTPAGYPPTNQPPGYPSSATPAGWPPANQQQGYPPANQPQGYPPAKQPQGYPPANQPPGYPPANQPSGYPGAYQPPGYPPTSQTAGYPGMSAASSSHYPSSGTPAGNYPPSGPPAANHPPSGPPPANYPPSSRPPASPPAPGFRSLTQDDVETLTLFFRSMDADGDGYITVAEICKACAVDLDHDGCISPMEAARCGNPWIAALAQQDRNGDSRITLQELLQFNDSTKGQTPASHPPPAAATHPQQPGSYGGPPSAPSGQYYGNAPPSSNPPGYPQAGGPPAYPPSSPPPPSNFYSATSGYHPPASIPSAPSGQNPGYPPAQPNPFPSAPSGTYPSAGQAAYPPPAYPPGNQQYPTYNQGYPPQGGNPPGYPPYQPQGGQAPCLPNNSSPNQYHRTS